jgi:chemotaxis protein histidine kinase CheA
MGVVRSAVERISGGVFHESEVGKDAKIRISLPLSTAVTQVTIVEYDGQSFDAPMDQLIETTRVHRNYPHDQTEPDGGFARANRTVNEPERPFRSCRSP